MKRLLLVVPFLGGCFDSLVSDPCAAGFSLQAGHCLANIDPGGPDAGLPGGGHDSGPGNPIDGNPGTPADALVCMLPDLLCDGACIDVSSDPDNCGACHHVCASGICTAGHCLGDPVGHIVAIGHDYENYHAAMARVLGNSAGLGRAQDLGIAWWRGTSTTQSHNGEVAALSSALQAEGRAWHVVPLNEEPTFVGIDVLIVDAQRGDGDAAEASALPWKPAIDGFLVNGGVVIVLETNNGVSYRFAKGAKLYTVGAPVDATGQTTMIVDTTDAVANQVVSPYLAESKSVTMPNAPHPVIDTIGGETIVFHTTR